MSTADLRSPGTKTYNQVAVYPTKHAAIPEPRPGTALPSHHPAPGFSSADCFLHSKQLGCKLQIEVFFFPLGWLENGGTGCTGMKFYFSRGRGHGQEEQGWFKRGRNAEAVPSFSAVLNTTARRLPGLGSLVAGHQQTPLRPPRPPRGAPCPSPPCHQAEPRRAVRPSWRYW